MATFDLELPDGTVIEGIPEGTTKEQIAAKYGPALKGSINPVMETAKTLGSALYGGATSLPRFVKTAGDWLEEKLPTPSWTKTPIPGGEVIGKADEAIRQGLEPETEAGQVAARIGEAGVSAILSPGGLAAPVRSAVVGLSSGAGAEVGRAIDPENPLLHLAGGLLGGGLGGLSTRAVTNRAALAREALQDVNPAHLDTAKQRMLAAIEEGVPINLSQAMPAPSNIDAYITALASSKHGTQTASMLRAQPMQVALEMENRLSALPGQLRMPQVLANNAQEAATAAITQAKQTRTDAWQRALERAQKSSMQHMVPEKVVAKAYEKFGKLAASVPNTSKAKLLEDFRNRLLTEDGFITDPMQLNEILKDTIGRLKPVNLATSGLDAGAAKWVGTQVAGLRDDFGKAFRPIRKANEAYQALTPAVDTLKKSVVGRIAGRAGARPEVEAAQHNLFSVFDKGTLPGATSSEILTLEKAFRTAGQPRVFQDAATTWIAGKVTSALKSTDNRMPGNIAERLRTAFGDPRQLDQTSKGFDDILAGLAHSQGAPTAPYVKGVKRFMSVVADAARRPSSVSGISAGEVKEMAGAGVSRHLGNLSLMTPLRQPALFWARMLEADALKKMDELLTSPQGVDMLIKLGKAQKIGTLEATAMGTFLGSTAEMQSSVGDNTPDVNNQ